MSLGSPRLTHPLTNNKIYFNFVQCIRNLRFTFFLPASVYYVEMMLKQVTLALVAYYFALSTVWY